MNVGIIGYQFMGKAHSNGWIKAPLFFNLNIKPVLKVACGRDEKAVKTFADKWGWQEVETDWKKVVENPDVDIIDISLPQHLHYDVAMAAARNGKHIFCEKPMAHSRKQAEEMLRAAEDNGVLHYLNHNYRRTPAVLLAKQLIDEGKIGRIFHWRGAYQQDWIVDPNFPLTWQLQKETAHAGPHWDLNSHSVDLALFLMGNIKTVSCLTTNFIKERPLPSAGDTAFSSGDGNNTQMGEVTVEDAALMMVEFESGAIGSFEASRFATGRKNANTFEIYGSKGSIAFNMERMNELQYFSNDDPENAQGFRTIIATESSHAYVSNWWPPGHTIGYEHGFVHAMADFMTALDRQEGITPNFNDGVRILAVLEAGLTSAQSGKKENVL